VSGVQVAKEVLKGNLSVWPNCKHIIHVSMPAFWFHWAGVNGFHFGSCHKYVGQQEGQWRSHGGPLDLSVVFPLVYEEGGVDTMFYKAGEILWEVYCCYVLPDNLQQVMYRNFGEKLFHIKADDGAVLCECELMQNLHEVQ
jgi:hypothetical protein